MRLSNLFTKTSRDFPADETSKNAQLLIRAGFVHKTMSGVYAYLPLGLRVLRKLEDIIRKHIDKTGAQETLLNMLHPKELWVKADNRWETLSILFRLKSQTDAEYALAQSNEEQITNIAKGYINSWKDLPEYTPYLRDYIEEITEKFDRTEQRYAAHAIIYNSKLDKYLITEDPFKIASLYSNYLVGGKIENGETKEDAIVREVTEETGILENQLTKVVYLGKIKQSFFAPKWKEKSSVNKIITSEMFYIETDSETDGFIDENKIDSKEYSAWKSKQELKGNLLPGFEWVLENYQDILSGKIGIVPPLAVYQIQTKFRDEFRSKSGLMRGREFRMKDLYDFHQNEASQDAYYEVVKQAYLDLYAEMGLEAFATRASGGAFSKFSHEFQVLTDAGEDWTVIWSDGVKDNLEISKGRPLDTHKISLGEKIYREGLIDDVKSVEQHAKAANLTTDRIIKSVLFKTLEEKPRLVGVAIRGDLTVNEELIIQTLDCGIEVAQDTELEVLGSTRGRFSPIKEIAESYTKEIYWIFDESIKGAAGMASSYYTQVDTERDLIQPNIWSFICEVKEGFVRDDSDENQQVVAEKIARSAEVGNIFKLGRKWTKESSIGVSYSDKNNQVQRPLMGCYGIGTTRCMGAIAEINSDEKGLKWPKSVAPFLTHLVININEKDDEGIKTKIETLSQQIYREELVLKVEKSEYKLVKSQEKSSGEVLFDDRSGISIGAKLTDAELIGCPYILIISKRSLENGGIELKIRETGETHILNLD